MSIGSVTTLDPGTSATASITGVTPNFILNLGIPQGIPGTDGLTGATGATGPQGIPGAQGPTGPTAKYQKWHILIINYHLIFFTPSINYFRYVQN